MLYYNSFYEKLITKGFSLFNVKGFVALAVFGIFSLMYASSSKDKTKEVAQRLHGFYECVIVTMEDDGVTQYEAEEDCRPSFYPEDSPEYSKY